MDIGEKVKNLRIQLGLTQDELAKRVGYTSKTTITKIESGDRNISQTKIVKLAKALNTTPSYLMGWEDELEEAALMTYRTQRCEEIFANMSDEQFAKWIAMGELLK